MTRSKVRRMCISCRAVEVTKEVSQKVAKGLMKLAATVRAVWRSRR